MNIAFDAKRAVFNYTGLGNYSRSLIRILLQHHPEHNYFLYTPSYNTPSYLSFLKEYNNVFIKTPVSFLNKTFKSFWRTFNLTKQLKSDKIDLYHGLSHELPVGINKTGIRSIVTIHDLIFLRYPDQYPLIDRVIYKKKVKYSCQAADRIIAVSEQTKSDIVNFLNIDENNIDVVYQPCHPVYLQEASEEKKKQVKERYNLPGSYILNVGTIETRKNLGTLVEAFNLLGSEDHLKIVVVGKSTNYVKKVKEIIERHHLRSKILFLSNIQLEDLPAIYQQAELFVYPSIFEGFGRPVIEALYSKVPVITTNGGCFTEAGGPNSLYVNSNNPDELKEAIEKILHNNDLKNSMIEAGYLYVQKFNEDNIAGGLIETYNRTA